MEQRSLLRALFASAVNQLENGNADNCCPSGQRSRYRRQEVPEKQVRQKGLGIRFAEGIFEVEVGQIEEVQVFKIQVFEVEEEA